MGATLRAQKQGGDEFGATEISLGDDALEPGYRVPPRPTHAVRLPDGTEVKFEINYAFHSPGSGFLQDAQRWAERTQSEAPHVPFKHYWSTYSDMDDAQKRWYFYWRTRLRAGEMLPTDLSYLFVHVYECLHAVGFEDAGEAFDHLIVLWKHYRAQHPNIDHYLGTWLLDLNAYYGVGHEPLALVRELTEDGLGFTDRDLAVAAWARTCDYDKLSPVMLANIADYDPRSGKFYREFPDTALINRTLRLALEAVDAYYTVTTGQGPIEKFAPPRTRELKRMAFTGAVFEFPRKEVSIATVPAFSESDILPHLLESALKFAENTLRKQVGFSGQRRGIELPPALETYLRRVLGENTSQPVARPVQRRSIAIDVDKLGELERDSNDIRGRLQSAAGGEADAMDVVDARAPNQQSGHETSDAGSTAQRPQDNRAWKQDPELEHFGSNAAAVAHSVRFDIPPYTPPGQLTDVDAVARILDDLSPAELALLHEARGRAWELAERQGDLLDQVNSATMAVLGEELITHEHGVAVVIDDYRDELAFLLALEEYSVPALPQGDAVRKSDASDDAPSAWIDFRRALTPLQVQALTQLIDGCSLAQVEAFAREHSTMPALLLDDINERALEFIGDAVIDTYAEPLTIFEEHQDAARSVILA